MARCEICGKEIEMKVFWKKYCGSKCRMDAYCINKAKNLKPKKKSV